MSGCLNACISLVVPFFPTAYDRCLFEPCVHSKCPLSCGLHRPVPSCRFLPDSVQYRKPGILPEELNTISMEVGDNEAVRRVRNARGKLFQLFNTTRFQARKWRKAATNFQRKMHMIFPAHHPARENCSFMRTISSASQHSCNVRVIAIFRNSVRSSAVLP